MHLDQHLEQFNKFNLILGAIQYQSCSILKYLLENISEKAPISQLLEVNQDNGDTVLYLIARQQDMDVDLINCVISKVTIALKGNKTND